MQVIRGLHNLPDKIKQSVVTIGNFDGFHLGHQELIKSLQVFAKEFSVPSVLITFEPQPNEVFHAGKPQPRLMRLREKIVAAEKLGIDFFVCIPFSMSFAAISAEDFIEKILHEQLGARAIVIGDDFRFGAKRAGDVHLLEKYSQQFGYVVKEHSTLTIFDERVSSTRIRHALKVGNFILAQQLLGSPYIMWGKVIHGDKRGRELGVPTANIFLHRQWVPVGGIFAVRVHGLDDGVVNGVANVGKRPAFNGERILLEVYLFDFNETIYGKHIGVEFCCKLRAERWYDDVDLLVQQMHCDIKNAKDYFGVV